MIAFDPAIGAFDAVCFLPGYARGLAFVNNYAVIGLSRPRSGAAFDGLLLGERLARDEVEPQCGLAVVNLTTGHIEHRLLMDGVIDELCSVAVLPGVRRPMAVGIQTDEIAYTVRPELVYICPNREKTAIGICGVEMP